MRDTSLTAGQKYLVKSSIVLEIIDSEAEAQNLVNNNQLNNYLSKLTRAIQGYHEPDFTAITKYIFNPNESFNRIYDHGGEIIIGDLRIEILRFIDSQLREYLDPLNVNLEAVGWNVNKLYNYLNHQPDKNQILREGLPRNYQPRLHILEELAQQAQIPEYEELFLNFYDHYIEIQNRISDNAESFQALRNAGITIQEILNPNVSLENFLFLLTHINPLAQFATQIGIGGGLLNSRICIPRLDYLLNNHQHRNLLLNMRQHISRDNLIYALAFTEFESVINVTLEANMNPNNVNAVLGNIDAATNLINHTNITVDELTSNQLPLDRLNIILNNHNQVIGLLRVSGNHITKNNILNDTVPGNLGLTLNNILAPNVNPENVVYLIKNIAAAKILMRPPQNLTLRELISNQLPNTRLTLFCKHPNAVQDILNSHYLDKNSVLNTLDEKVLEEWLKLDYNNINSLTNVMPNNPEESYFDYEQLLSEQNRNRALILIKNANKVLDLRAQFTAQEILDLDENKLSLVLQYASSLIQLLKLRAHNDPIFTKNDLITLEDDRLETLLVKSRGIPYIMEYGFDKEFILTSDKKEVNFVLDNADNIRALNGENPQKFIITGLQQFIREEREIADRMFKSLNQVLLYLYKYHSSPIDISDFQVKVVNQGILEYADDSISRKDDFILTKDDKPLSNGSISHQFVVTHIIRNKKELPKEQEDVRVKYSQKYEAGKTAFFKTGSVVIVGIPAFIITITNAGIHIASKTFPIIAVAGLVITITNSVIRFVFEKGNKPIDRSKDAFLKEQEDFQQIIDSKWFFMVPMLKPELKFKSNPLYQEIGRKNLIKVKEHLDTHVVDRMITIMGLLTETNSKFVLQKLFYKITHGQRGDEQFSNVQPDQLEDVLLIDNNKNITPPEVKIIRFPKIIKAAVSLYNLRSRLQESDTLDITYAGYIKQGQEKPKEIKVYPEIIQKKTTLKDRFLLWLLELWGAELDYIEKQLEIAPIKGYPDSAPRTEHTTLAEIKHKMRTIASDKYCQK